MVLNNYPVTSNAFFAAAEEVKSVYIAKEKIKDKARERRMKDDKKKRQPSIWERKVLSFPYDESE